MNKDVIYIDVDDDVTAIIGKIKKAKEKIVAIVPPKRAGALQSAVNLRLLERMAKTDKKKLVLITANPALVALAANAKIPVAKNLQSKPELAEIPAIIVDDGDDIIDGSELPVGDHANTVKVKDGTKPVASDVRSAAIDATDLEIDGEGVAATSAVKSAPNKAKNRPKIPNFDTFRKKLFFIITGGIGLVALLIWMFVFAPAATVVITASTAPQPVSATVKLGGTTATDYKAGVVSSTSQQEKKDETVSFDATGKGLVGEKATGSVVFRNCEAATPISIAAGTTISASGNSYVTQSAVTVPGGSGGFGGCTSPGVSSPVAVTAADVGDKFNVPSGTTFSVAGHPNSSGVYMRASASTAIDGGSSREVKVVSADDIERAKGQLIGQSTDDQKKALSKKFTNNEVIIDSSFTVDRAAPVSAPAVNQEAPDGKATLTVSTTYSMQAVPKAELETYLKSWLQAKIDTNKQKVYSTGIDKATLSNFQKATDGSMTATLNATGRVGPKINESDIKNEVKGKRYGEVQQTLESQEGIKQVDVQFSFFWVRTVPNNTDKITIEFKVDND